MPTDVHGLPWPDPSAAAYTGAASIRQLAEAVDDLDALAPFNPFTGAFPYLVVTDRTGWQTTASAMTVGPLVLLTLLIVRVDGDLNLNADTTYTPGVVPPAAQDVCVLPAPWRPRATSGLNLFYPLSPGGDGVLHGHGAVSEAGVVKVTTVAPLPTGNKVKTGVSIGMTGIYPRAGIAMVTP